MRLFDDVGPRGMLVKAALFLVGGTLSVGTLLFEHTSLRDAVLLGCAIWCFCRLYYFFFHVVGMYLGGERRFTGMVDALRFLCRRGRALSRGAGGP